MANGLYPLNRITDIPCTYMVITNESFSFILSIGTIFLDDSSPRTCCMDGVKFVAPTGIIFSKRKTKASDVPETFIKSTVFSLPSNVKIWTHKQ